MKYLIVGLGNIGEEYNDTRHNIGFQVLDQIANKSELSFDLQRYGFVTKTKYKGRTYIFLKPSTYMNLSGKAVKYWLDKEKLSPNNLLIVVDDIALPFGKIRIKGKGNDGGHNGLKDITNTLGNNNFPRLRFGIGDAFNKGSQVNHVLGHWSSKEKNSLTEPIELTIKAILSFGTIGLNRTMNEFNS